MQHLAWRQRYWPVASSVKNLCVPNPTLHIALATLELRGLVSGVITQNVGGCINVLANSGAGSSWPSRPSAVYGL